MTNALLSFIRDGLAQQKIIHMHQLYIWPINTIHTLTTLVLHKGSSIIYIDERINYSRTSYSPRVQHDLRNPDDTHSTPKLTINVKPITPLPNQRNGQDLSNTRAKISTIYRNERKTLHLTSRYKSRQRRCRICTDRQDQLSVSRKGMALARCKNRILSVSCYISMCTLRS